MTLRTLKQRRKRLGLTQAALARGGGGLYPANVSLAESGTGGLNLMRRVRKTLIRAELATRRCRQYELRRISMNTNLQGYRTFRLEWIASQGQTRRTPMDVKAIDALAAIRQARHSGRMPPLAVVVHVELAK